MRRFFACWGDGRRVLVKYFAGAESEIKSTHARRHFTWRSHISHAKRMFGRKNEKRIVELNPEELWLAKYALLGFRNKLVAQGKPTEDVNELLLKIMKYR